MTDDKNIVRTKKGTREYTYLGCPLTRSRTAWCFRLCAPDDAGHGRCGRIAPHGLTGRTAESIKDFNAKAREIHCEKLVHLYLAAPYNEYLDPGIRIAEGEAEIVVPIQGKFLRPGQSVHGSVCFAAMNDSAMFAVNSMVPDFLVVTENFDVQLTGAIASGEMIARARLLGTSGERYLAESVLTDADGNELGRGNGAFVVGELPLSPDIGYV